MIGGYNHNVTYRGTVFHVQTEDSGPKRPQLVTLLYHGGTIIASQKTLYDDILKVDNLNQVLEELAKEQHKGMLRQLARGDFDRKIETLGIKLTAAAGEQTRTQNDPVVASAKEEDAPDLATQPSAAAEYAPAVKDDDIPQVSPMTELDQLIYAYLTAGREVE